jgi:uncharacterized protein HemY
LESAFFFPQFCHEGDFMNSKPFWLLLIFLAIPGLAQNNFYLQVYREGLTSMEMENYQKAEELFKIAAFGFLDYPDYLLSCRIRLVLIASQLNQQDKLQDLLFRIKALRNNTHDEHSRIDDAAWNEYLILAGEKERGLVPAPDDLTELNGFIKQHPDRLDAWYKYFNLLKNSGNMLSGKSMLKEALRRFPEDISLLETGLEMDYMTKRRRSSLSRAAKILVLAPDNACAHEILGLEALRKKRHLEARDHFKYVHSPCFPETKSAEQRLNEWFVAQAAAEEATKLKALEVKQTSSKPPRVLQPAENKVEDSQLEQSNPTIMSTNKKNATEEKSSTKKPALSQRDLETRVRKDPSNADTRFDLVEYLLDHGNLRKTKKHLAILGKQDSKNPRYLAAFAQYHFMQKKYDQVTSGLFGLDNLNDKANYYLGKSYQNLNDHTQAFTILSSIHNPEVFPGLVEELTMLKQNLDPSYEFIKTFGKHWDTQKLNKKQKETVLFTLLDKNDAYNSEKYANRFIEEYPKEDIAQYFKARVLLLQEHYLEASEVFYRLANSGYRDHETYFYSGYAFFKSNKPFVTKYMLEKAKQYGSKHGPEIEDILSRLP